MSRNTKKIPIQVVEEILTVEKVAEILNITERTVLDKLRDGEIVGYKKFRQWYVLKSDLIKLIMFD